MHLLPFALGSFLGPLTLGRLFDKIGRKPMITATYGIAGALLLAAAGSVRDGIDRGREGLGICLHGGLLYCFVGGERGISDGERDLSAGDAGLRHRDLLCVGTLVGGVGAPLLFGVLIHSGSRADGGGWGMGWERADAGRLRCVSGRIGVEAAGQSLESVSKPLQSQ